MPKRFEARLEALRSEVGEGLARARCREERLRGRLERCVCVRRPSPPQRACETLRCAVVVCRCWSVLAMCLSLTVGSEASVVLSPSSQAEPASPQLMFRWFWASDAGRSW